MTIHALASSFLLTLKGMTLHLRQIGWIVLLTVALAQAKAIKGPDDQILRWIQNLPTDKLYINGTWVDSLAETPTFFDVVDPSTAKVVAKVLQASAEDVNAAVLAAKQAWPTWNYHTSREQRQRLVTTLIDVYSSRFEEMAHLISTEMGSPIDAARSSHTAGGRGNIKSAIRMFANHFEFERPLPNIHPEQGDEQLSTIL